MPLRLRGLAAVTMLVAVVATGSFLIQRPGDEVPRADVPRTDDPIPRAPAPAGETAFCIDAGDVESADELMAGRFKLNAQPAIDLGRDLTWGEDPFGDPNWRFRLHNLRWTRHLRTAWEETGDERYLQRYRFYLRDWFQNNPPDDPPSDFSWRDHPTGIRAMEYACASELFDEPWAPRALLLHGEMLADPDFYHGRGNHALNMNLGLLTVGCVAERRDWIDTAKDRILELLFESVDEQGVTNEQSIFYQLFNHRLYGFAEERLEICEEPVPDALAERRALMPRFLAHATLPNGEYETLGDTSFRRAALMPRTVAEYAATRGRRGELIDELSVIYDAGFAFGRSAWADEDALFYSLRFGPGPYIHGHADGTAMTLYGYGRRLLIDPGMYGYTQNKWRAYVKDPHAHNRVTVDGARYENDARTDLIASADIDGVLDYRAMRTEAWERVTATRRVVYLRRLGAFLVADELRSPAPKTFRQLWHLMPGASPTLGDARASTSFDRGNVAFRWAGDAPRLEVVEGREDPVQGWISDGWLQMTPAPVIEAVVRGTDVWYLTLIVPHEGRRADAGLRSVRRLPDGFSAEVRVGDVTERVVVSGAEASAERR